MDWESVRKGPQIPRNSWSALPPLWKSMKNLFTPSPPFLHKWSSFAKIKQQEAASASDEKRVISEKDRKWFKEPFKSVSGKQRLWCGYGQFMLILLPSKRWFWIQAGWPVLFHNGHCPGLLYGLMEGSLTLWVPFLAAGRHAVTPGSPGQIRSKSHDLLHNMKHCAKSKSKLQLSEKIWVLEGFKVGPPKRVKELTELIRCATDLMQPVPGKPCQDCPAHLQHPAPGGFCGSEMSSEVQGALSDFVCDLLWFNRRIGHIWPWLAMAWLSDVAQCHYPCDSAPDNSHHNPFMLCLKCRKTGPAPSPLELALHSQPAVAANH